MSAIRKLVQNSSGIFFSIPANAYGSSWQVILNLIIIENTFAYDNSPKNRFHLHAGWFLNDATYHCR
jgi:hypothetical protein